ncbi:MAG: CHAD domain-containing protein, partial [Planctomycetes bacterium]|nr:CHAD domain-containing protein [Planctomycetota bacterium]
MDPNPSPSPPPQAPAPGPAARPPAARKAVRGRGLAWWMRQVRSLALRCRTALDEEPVHDLRTALRRCRTIASSLRKFDPDPDWDRMNRGAKSVFGALGDLRDVQVMAGWVRTVSPPGDASGAAMLERLA